MKRLLVAVLAVAASAVSAETGTWIRNTGVGTGGTDWADWDDTDNWQDGVVAQGGADYYAALTAASGQYIQLPDSLTLNGIMGKSSDYAILRGTGGLTLISKVHEKSSQYLYLYTPVTFGSSSEYYGWRDIQFCGPISSILTGTGYKKPLMRGTHAFRYDLYATDGSATREITLFPGITDPSLCGDGTLKFYAPHGSSEDITSAWDQVAGSPFLSRASGQAEHPLAAGTAVTGEGIPAGTFLKHVFPDGTIELSAAPASTVPGNALTFAAFTADVRLTLPGQLRAFDANGMRTVRVQKYREEDSITLGITNLRGEGAANRYFTLGADAGMLPGLIELDEVQHYTSTTQTVVTLENSHLKFGSGKFAYATFQIPNAAHAVRLTVDEDASRSVRFSRIAGTLIKDGPGKQAVYLPADDADALTGRIVVEAGELHVGGVTNFPSVELKAGTVLSLDDGDVTIDSFEAEPGATLRGCCAVKIKGASAETLAGLKLEGVSILDPEPSDGPLSFNVISGGYHPASEGDDAILVFSSNAILRVNGSGVADILVVGGGGGGGGLYGGGGGGGGVLYRQGVRLESGVYGLVVGKGGVGSLCKNPIGTDGGDSLFCRLHAHGGGAGGTYRGGNNYWPDNGKYITYGRPGASGGGGGCQYPQGSGDTPGGDGIEGQGHKGGTSHVGKDGTETCGGGGGGAAEPGEDAVFANSVMTGACGGDGVLCAIWGEKYYGGGGGAGGPTECMSASAGLGGLGGGGDGGKYSGSAGTGMPGKDGVDGLGGGGGGGSAMSRDARSDATCYGGRGGDGVVIIRFRRTIDEKDLPLAPIATGGTITKRHSYAVHTFHEDGTFELPQNAFVDVLVVGGGGGGGYQAGGGGGGGAVIVQSNLYIQAGTYSVKVGVGGAGATGHHAALAALNGGESQFLDFVAIGGGSGGGRTFQCRQGGASGGGAGAPYFAESLPTAPGAPGTEGLGYAGGASTNNYSSKTLSISIRTSGGGGGGGAGEPGADAPREGQGGKGGDGIACDFSGTSLFYGGGGGGGSSYPFVNESNPYLAEGGRGGGGRGAGISVNANQSGVAHLGEDGKDGFGGGGGGGSGYGDTWKGGGKGGDGVVILRYPLMHMGMILIVR